MRPAAAYRAVKMLPAARVLLAAIVVLAAEVAPSSKLALNRGYAACTLPPADVLRRRSLAAAAPAVSASGAACPPPPAPGSSCTELESVVTSSYYPGDPARTAVSCWIYDEDVKAKRCSLDLDSGPAGGGGAAKCWQQCAKDAAGAAGAAAWELLPGVAHDGQSTGPHTICAIYNAVPGNRALKGPSFDSRSASGCTALGVSRDNASATSCCKDAPPLPPPTAPDWHCAGPPCWHCIPKPPGNTTTGIPLKDCELGCWYGNVFFAMQFILTTTFLPRQARDKRRKSRGKNTFLQGAAATTLEVVVQQHQRELPRGARLQDNAVHCEQGYV